MDKENNELNSEALVDNDIVASDEPIADSSIDCGSKKKEKKKKKWKIDWLLLVTVITGLAAAMLVHQFSVELIKTVEYMYTGVNEAIEDMVWVDESHKPDSFSEKYAFYKDIDSQDYCKYSEPIPHKIAEQVAQYNNNYNATVIGSLDINGSVVRVDVDMDVDGDLAKGLISISCTDPARWEEGSVPEEHQYEYEYEFIRILENGAVTNYIKIGDQWYKKNGIVYFDNHVAIDLCKLANSWIGREYTFAPTVSDGKGWISFRMDDEFLFTDFGKAMYEECDEYAERHVSFDLDTFMPYAEVKLYNYVDELQMKKAGKDIGDPFLNYICDNYNFRMFYAFNFHSYGESEVVIDEQIVKNAISVEDFSLISDNVMGMLEQYKDYEEVQ